ncbi:MAG: DUF4157 domain-containing protein [Nostoc sp.]|uniref:eCIS core domain-containing protein n=1 Tax=Nostoc sp. TaxID=1180 RepID=UPI002FFD3939
MATPQSDRSIQREIGPKKEKEKIQMKPSLQLAPDGNQEAGGNLEGRLNSSKGGGSPLPDDVRSFMEPRFGADFSQVRVHTGRESVQMNQDLNAQAFTHKQDIYFGAGKAPAKDALTAHELTHVVQQCSSAGTLQRQPAIRSTPASRPDSAPGLGPTRTEEVENLIKAGDFQGAIDTLVGYKYMDHEIDLNLLADKKMTYDPNLKASDATTSMPSWDYLSTPEKAEPAKVKVGSSAFSSVSYFYSVIMHEYQHVLWQQTLAHQKQSHLAHSQGDMAPDEVEAGAWELLHATETGVARLPDKVAQIWENLNDAFWKLDPKAQASERQLVVRAFQKAKTFMKGSQLTLVPFSPP